MAKLASYCKLRINSSGINGPNGVTMGENSIAHSGDPFRGTNMHDFWMICAESNANELKQNFSSLPLGSAHEKFDV